MSTRWPRVRDPFEAHGLVIKYGPRELTPEQKAARAKRFQDELTEMFGPRCEHVYDDGRCLLCGDDLEYTPVRQLAPDRHY